MYFQLFHYSVQNDFTEDQLLCRLGQVVGFIPSLGSWQAITLQQSSGLSLVTIGLGQRGVGCGLDGSTQYGMHSNSP